MLPYPHLATMFSGRCQPFPRLHGYCKGDDPFDPTLNGQVESADSDILLGERVNSTINALRALAKYGELRHIEDAASGVPPPD